MPQNRFDLAYYLFSGIPAANGTLNLESSSGSVAFQFVVNATITTPEQIEIGDLSTAAEVAERTADVINGSDLNQGWSAVANGTHTHLTPPSGQNPGSCHVSKNATNVAAVGDSPAPNGVIVIGS